jgi:adenylate cyclase
MSTTRMKRRLSAIMSMDVKDFARLMQDDETATVRTLTAYKEVMGDIIGRYGGRVVDAPGDNLLAEFISVLNAVWCAVEVQDALRGRNDGLPRHRRMAFRIGINLGDILVDGDRIYGDGVNIAARLMALAEPGGICISQAIHDQVEDKLTFAFRYLGRKVLKNIDKPIPVFNILTEQAKTSHAPAFEHNGRLRRHGFLSRVTPPHPPSDMDVGFRPDADDDQSAGGVWEPAKRMMPTLSLWKVTLTSLPFPIPEISRH